MKKTKTLLILLVSISTILGTSYSIYGNETKQEDVEEATIDSNEENIIEVSKSELLDDQSVKYRDSYSTFKVYQVINLTDFKLNEFSEIEETEITNYPQLEFNLVGPLGKNRERIEIDRFIATSRGTVREITLNMANIVPDGDFTKEFRYHALLRMTLLTPIPKHFVPDNISSDATLSISGTGGEIATVIIETPNTVMDFRTVNSLAPVQLTQSLEPINGIVNPSDFSELVKEITTDIDLYNVSGDLIAKAGERIATVHFDENGNPTDEVRLPVGEFTIKDIQVPTQYKLDSTGVHFTMSTRDWGKDLGNFEAKVYQQSVKINEYSNKDASQLEKSEYKLYHNDSLLDVQPEIDNQSIVFNDLYTGNYKLVKSYSQKGYATTEDNIEFTIDNTNTNAPIDINKKTSKNVNNEFGGQVINIFNDPTITKFEFNDVDTDLELHEIEAYIIDNTTGETVAEVSDLTNLETSNLEVDKEYKLVVTKIPSGYEAIEDYIFKVQDTGDLQLHDLKLHKKAVPNLSIPVKEYLVNTFLNESNVKDKKELLIGQGDYVLSQDNLSWTFASDNKLSQLDKTGLVDAKYGFYGYRISYTDGTFELSDNQTINYTDLSNHANSLGKEIKEVYVSYGPKSTIDINYYLNKKDGSQSLLLKDSKTDYFADKLDGYFDVQAGQLSLLPVVNQYIQAANNPEGPFNYEKDNQEITINLREPEINVHFVDTSGNTLLDSINFSSKIGDLFTYVAPTIDGYKTINNDSISTLYEGKDLDITITYENEEPVIQTARVISKFIDADGNTLLDDKIISGQAGSVYGVNSEKIEGYRLIEVLGNQNGEFVNGVTLVVFIYEKEEPGLKTGIVTSRFIDTNGNTLLDDITISGQVGFVYGVNSEKIEGYRLIEVLGNQKGEFIDGDILVTFVYEKDEVIETGHVISRFIDADGNTLLDEITISGQVGEEYKVESQPIYAHHLKEIIGNESGTFTKDDVVITYIYEKDEVITDIGRVIVNFVDTEGKQILKTNTITGQVGLIYGIDASSIEGYKLKEVKGNQKGSFTLEDSFLTFVYEKETSEVENGSVVIKYVDTDNNELSTSKTLSGIVGTAYQTKAIEIAGYTLDHIVGNESGSLNSSTQEVTYVYAKNKVTKPDEKNPDTGTTEPKDTTSENKEIVASETKEAKPNTGVQVNSAFAIAGLVVSSSFIAILLAKRKKLKDNN